MNTILLIGRIMFAFMFIGSAIGHFKNTAAMTGYASFKGVPAPKLAVLGSGLLLALGGLSVLLTVYPAIGALVLFVFLTLSAVIFHDYWKASAETKMNEQISFNKNIALAGAALIIYVLYSNADKLGLWVLVN